MSAQRLTGVATAVPAPVPAARPDLVSPADPRYADLADRHLAVTLSTEDMAEERGLNPLERITCRLHRRWLHQCISSPAHVIPVTGHRWCRTCHQAVTIAVDELTGDIGLTCPRCHATPEGPATRQIVRCCRSSLAAAAEPWSTQDNVNSLRRKPSRHHLT